MAHPMVEWVLDTYFSNTFKYPAEVECLLQTEGVYESELIPMIEAVLAAYPELKIACLPKSDLSRQVELGVKGQQKIAQAGFKMLLSLLDQAQINHKAHGQ